VKLSVSLPEEDVEFLDAYAEAHGIESRSQAVRAAIRVLRTAGIGAAYERAWDDWSRSGEDAVWDAAVADGLT
jgi:Arc/MetJ-type ribon-helix-helix transcriptional regulator